MSAIFRLVILSLVVLVASLVFGAQLAHADCLPIAYKRYVGNTTTDALCTENDIQTAINNSVCPTTIYVSNERAWTAQHLDINNKNLTIVGRTGGCGVQVCDGGCAVPTAPVVVLSGSGHSGDSVMYIHGTSNITLQYVEIKNGNNINGTTNTYGGGIHFDGQGSLVLDTMWVRNNVARYGGGINMSGTSGFAGLTVLGGTRIENNQAANDGGGIRITDSTYMSILYDHTLIWLNQALNGHGGGIQVKGPAHADIGSPGETGLGVIYSNSAKYGGGISIDSGTGFGNGDADVQLFTVDPNRPVRVHGNSASVNGGGVYLEPYVGIEGYMFASLCAFDFRIEDNTASEGSAIYGENNTSAIDSHIGSTVLLNPLNNLCAGLPEFAQRCAAGVACNIISGNGALNPDGSPTLGATLYLKAYGTLEAERLTMRSNNGGYAIHMADPYVNYHTLDNCLLANNNVTRQLIRTDAGDLDIRNCTFVNNTILSTNSIYSGGPLTMFYTIIDQPGNNALGYGGNASDLHVDYMLSSDVSTLPAAPGVLAGQPTYVNAAAGDYHLALNSLGVDFGPAIVGDDRDLDLLPHDQDIPEVPNVFGVRDLGAYERQRTFACGAADTIFCDGFNN